MRLIVLSIFKSNNFKNIFEIFKVARCGNNNEVDFTFAAEKTLTSTFSTTFFHTFKENAQFLFLFNPPKSLVNVCLMNIIKNDRHKKT